MSTSVDNKVVKLELDNQQFESGAKQSESTLKKLKGSMTFDEQNKKLQQLGDTSKKVFLQDMSSSLNQLSDRFSVKGIAIMSTISNLTNRVVDAGMNMAKALTIQPITSGLQEYETQMNAIQTIMANTASKGTTLEQVNEVLNELNVYADKTIYNFSEMTRNIGTFTAAGVGLRESTDAIKGIANLAAMSGSNSQQAATAMYQLSQALAAGTVKLMDWNSVVNAGMGGENFQNALKETARVHGVAVDDMIAKEGSFRESLKYGWITSEILIETLRKFTGDLSAEQLKSMGYTDEQTKKILALGKTANEAATKVKTFTQLKDTTFEALGSGWAQSWQIIIGDFNDARDMLTDISDTINDLISKTSNARNQMLSQAFKGKDVGTEQYQKLADQFGPASQAVKDFEALMIKTAKSNGVAIDDMIKQDGSFAESLKRGWLNESLIKKAFSDFEPFEYLNMIDQMKNANTSLGESFQALAKKKDGVHLSDLEGLGLSSKALKSFEEELQKVAETELPNFKKLESDYGSFENMLLRSDVITGDMLQQALVNWEDITMAQAANSGYTAEQVEQMKKYAMETGNVKLMMKSLFEEVKGGRTYILEAFGNIGKFIGSVFKPISDAWRQVFPPQLGNTIRDVLKGFRDLTAQFKLSADAQNGIRNTFVGIFSVVKAVTRVVGLAAKVVGGTLVTAFKMAMAVINPVISVITNITGVIGSLVGKIQSAIPSFKNLFAGFEDSGLSKFVDGIKAFASAIGTGFVTAISSIATPFRMIGDAFNSIDTSGAADMFYRLGKAIGDFLGMLDMTSLKNFGDSLKEAFQNFKLDVFFQNIGKAFSEGFDNLKLGLHNALIKLTQIDYQAIADNIKKGLLAAINGIGTFLAKFVDFLKNPVKQAHAAELESVQDIEESTGKTQITLQTIIGDFAKAGAAIVNFGKDIWNTLSGLTGSLFDMVKRLFDGFDWDEAMTIFSDGLMVAIVWTFRKWTMTFATELPKLISAVGNGISGFLNMFNGVNKILSGFAMSIKAEAIKKIAISLAILAGSLFLLSKIDDMSKAAQGLGLLAGGLTAMTAALVTLGKLLGNADIQAGFGPKGLFFNKKGTDFTGIAVGMIGLSVAMLAFAAALRVLEGVNWETLGKAGLVLGGLTGSFVLIGKFGGSTAKTSASIGLMALSLMLLGKAFQQYANIFANGDQLENLANGMMIMVTAFLR